MAEIGQGHNSADTTWISNSFLQDDRLGYDTRGMILSLLSLPTNTEITFETILQTGPSGRDKTYRMLKEAEQYGYIARRVIRSNGTKIGKHLYLVSDEPSLIPPAPVEIRASDVYERERIPLAVRRAVYKRDGFACLECGARHKLSLDHEVPVSSGGDNSEENLRTLCLDCNFAKGATVGDIL
jgi:hypothetical protein